MARGYSRTTRWIHLTALPAVRSDGLTEAHGVDMTYEFKIFTFSETEDLHSYSIDWPRLQSQLNEFGQVGWDIAGLQPLPRGGPYPGVVVFLKRPAA